LLGFSELEGPLGSGESWFEPTRGGSQRQSDLPGSPAGWRMPSPETGAA